MRKCDNCHYGIHSLNVSTGIETLYCTEDFYMEYEMEPNDVCELHQFIDGDGNEKNIVVYDDRYFGKGYFIVHLIDGNITQFLKLYCMNDNGYPHYGLRAFSVDNYETLENEFSSIEFTFRSGEDYDNGLYEAFLKFMKNENSVIYTIDSVQQGKNNISTTMQENVIKFVVSKDNFRGKQHPSNFIDLNLGDDYSCQNYEAINELYNTLSEICRFKSKEQFIERLLVLTKNRK